MMLMVACARSINGSMGGAMSCSPCRVRIPWFGFHIAGFQGGLPKAERLSGEPAPGTGLPKGAKAGSYGYGCVATIWPACGPYLACRRYAELAPTSVGGTSAAFGMAPLDEACKLCAERVGMLQLDVGRKQPW